MSLADDWGPSRHHRELPGARLVSDGAEQACIYDDEEWVEYLVDRIPLRRPGRPEDLEGAIVFLASDASAYITGQTLLVDGGITTGSIRALPRTKVIRTARTASTGTRSTQHDEHRHF